MKTRRAVAAGAIAVLWVLAPGIAAFWKIKPDSCEQTRVFTAQRGIARPYGDSTATFRPKSADGFPLDISFPTALERLPHRLRAALGAAEKELDPDLREELLVGLVAEMDGNELREATVLLDNDGASAFTCEVQGRLLRKWAETEPSEAAHAALEVSSQNRSDAIEGVIGVWADGNLADAIAWVHKLPEGELQNHAMVSLAYEAARVQPEEALRLAGRLAPGEARNEVLVFAAAQWAANSPAVAARWASEANDNTLRERLQAAVAVAWSDSDPLEAVNFALTSMSNGTLQDHTVIGIVQRWAQKDPHDIAPLVEMLPDSAMRDTAMENLVKLWANRNAEAAGSWLNSLVGGAVRDRGVSAFAENLAPSSPAMAMAWARSIHDTNLREQKVKTVGEMWMRKDPTGAAAYGAQNSLLSSDHQRWPELGPTGK